MNVEIRNAELSDMSDVFSLVNQLAAYERAAEEVTTSASVYERDFAEKKFDVIVAVHEQKIIGMALYYIAYSTWKGNYLWLEDFVVNENYRGKGVGKLLFEEIIRLSKNYNAFFKWQVLDWNEPAISFYHRYGFEVQKEWLTCKLRV